MTPLWPQQDRALGEIATAMGDGCQRILVASPTGSGKTRIMEEVLAWGYSAILYTDRRKLLDQLAQRLRAAGFQFGIRASGYDVNILPDIQLAMVQTEHSRVIEAEDREHHKAKIVLFDEAHRLGAEQAQKLRALHIEDGATLLGFTATPVGLGHLYDRLIVAAVNSECRRIGALLPAYHYAPDEPDMRDMEKHRLPTGDFSSTELNRRFVRPVIFGRVYDHWTKLNPDARPTILFGPDVAGSKWFAEQFEARGVPTAHVDGEDIIIRGDRYESSREVMRELIEDYKAGEITLLTNRFVLREGIDIPEIYHCILATAFGSLTSYIQAGGRVLRNHPSMDHVVVQDHGGNWWRHGSLNSDRHWRLDDTEKALRQQRKDRLTSKEAPEPIACPQCNAVRSSGKECPNCGHVSHGQSRVVIQKNGELKRLRGDIFRKPKESDRPQDEKDWISTLFRMANAKTPKTFNQACGLFARDHDGRRPNRDWPMVPTGDVDGSRYVTRETLRELGRANAERKRRESDTAAALFQGVKQ